MLFQRINRTAPEKIFAICRNSEASAEMFDGEVVVWSAATTAAHGSDVLKSAGASPLTIAGVVKSRAASGAGNGIAAGEYGTIQIYGFHANVKTTVAALAASLQVNGDSAAAAVAAAVEGAMLGVSLKLGASNRAGIFIKCMG